MIKTERNEKLGGESILGPIQVHVDRVPSGDGRIDIILTSSHEALLLVQDLVKSLVELGEGGVHVISVEGTVLIHDEQDEG